ncbi:UDP-Glycosyltransferase/glycogen phosphorylase [Rhizophagus irregularis]|uniref:UDP-Glycosyltransferase/glycogen phosphorylase n=1 Tax=Rhizophagus irregularis TaxID=588596 RepID=A0A2I1GJG7_9GLOM|nr:UDP-Glycosyltransferase/glycogen phosphorylase [Rhizophagus irregularis]
MSISSISDLEPSQSPKNVLLLAVGSMGDVIPFVNLGFGFRQRGHNVIIAANSRFRSLIEEKKFAFREMNWDMQHEWENTDSGRRMVKFSSYSILGSPFMFKFLKQGFQKSYSDAANVLKNVDFVVLGTGAAYMYPECLVRNIPVAYICFYPWASTKSYAGDYVASFWSDIGLLPIYNKRLKELGLPKAGRLPWLPGGAFEKNQILVIHALNKNLIQIQKNPLNPLNEVQLDYPYLSIEEELEDYVPPNDLVEFLSIKGKPIYFGYGSMHSFSDVKSRVSIWLRVMDLLPENQRALFSGVGSVESEELNDAVKNGRVFILNHVPHSWLLPQVSCVVHHGGAGTTHAVIRAGVPSIVSNNNKINKMDYLIYFWFMKIPHFADQPWWASILYHLGVAPSTGIQANAVTAEKITTELLIVLSNKEIKEKADKIGSKIRKEQKRSPVSKIVAYIEKYWEKTNWDVLTLDDEQQKIKEKEHGYHPVNENYPENEIKNVLDGNDFSLTSHDVLSAELRE